MLQLAIPVIHFALVELFAGRFNPEYVYIYRFTLVTIVKAVLYGYWIFVALIGVMAVLNRRRPWGRTPAANDPQAGLDIMATTVTLALAIQQVEATSMSSLGSQETLIAPCSHPCGELEPIAAPEVTLITTTATVTPCSAVPQETGLSSTITAIVTRPASNNNCRTVTSPVSNHGFEFPYPITTSRGAGASIFVVCPTEVETAVATLDLEPWTTVFSTVTR